MTSNGLSLLNAALTRRGFLVQPKTDLNNFLGSATPADNPYNLPIPGTPFNPAPPANWRRGLLAPIEKNEATGQFRPAIPGILMNVLSAVTLPGDVLAGKVDPQSDEAIQRSMEFASLLTLGAGAVPGPINALRSGANSVGTKYPRLPFMKQVGQTAKQGNFKEATRLARENGLVNFSRNDARKFQRPYSLPGQDPLLLAKRSRLSRRPTVEAAKARRLMESEKRASLEFAAERRRMDEYYRRNSPEFLASQRIQKRNIQKIAKAHGYTKVRDKGGSFYYEKRSDQLGGRPTRIRFSDHQLGTDWTGRQQTAGANADIIDWQELSNSELMRLFKNPDEF